MGGKRVDCAKVKREWGAWLVTINDETEGDPDYPISGPEDHFAAAGTLKEAKQVAESLAKHFGWQVFPKDWPLDPWERIDRKTYVLKAWFEEDDEEDE